MTNPTEPSLEQELRQLMADCYCPSESLMEQDLPNLVQAIEEWCKKANVLLDKTAKDVAKTYQQKNVERGLL